MLKLDSRQKGCRDYTLTPDDKGCIWITLGTRGKCSLRVSNDGVDLYVKGEEDQDALESIEVAPYDK